MKTNSVLTFVTLTVMCILGNIIAAKIRATQSDNSFQLVCATGYVLKARKDWTDQQPVGTNFAGFTCCPNTHQTLLYLNENYFCCPTGSGGSCMSNSCRCDDGDLKGGIFPVITKLK